MDGQSHKHDSLLARPCVAATRWIIAYPWPTLACAALAALLCLVYTSQNLEYRTSRLDLLNPETDYNRLWIEYLEEFGDADDAVIVVQGPDRQSVVPVLQSLSRAIVREDEHFHAVLHEVDLRKIRSKGLHYLSPDELLQIDQFLNEVNPLLAGDWGWLSIGNLTASIVGRMEQSARVLQQLPPASADGSPGAAGGSPLSQLNLQRDQLERFTASLLSVLQGSEKYLSPWPPMPASFATLSELNSEYLLMQEGKLGFVLLRLTPSADKMGPNKAIDVLRDLIARVQSANARVKIGLTGLPVMEDDEMRTSKTSMIWAGIISFIGVGFLFVAGFGGIRHALLANAILLVGMAWAFGYATFSVGHLNILSVTFTATLIGVGIDFGIYYAARYLDYRKQGLDVEAALLESARSASPSIITGAVTTSVAFFSAGLTSFTGVSELGIIAGGGILLCALAELALLPAAIVLVDRTEMGKTLPTPLPIAKWTRPFHRLPRVTLGLGISFSIFLGLGLPELWYDNNLLNMQAEGLESVELERMLLEECNQSMWYALSIADSREELLAKKAAFLKLPSVERTEEIVSMLPPDDEFKQPLIRRIEQRLASLPERPPLIPIERPEKVGQLLGQLQQMLSMAGSEDRSVQQIEQSRDLLRRLPLADCYAVVSRFQQNSAGDLLSRLHVLASVANPDPPQLDDLPGSLVDRFVGHHGKHLLKIYGKGNIWDSAALERFTQDVRSVDPLVTGNPLQAHEASQEMRASFMQAAIYSLLVICGVLMLEFRNFRDVLLAALPLAFAMLQTFGLLGLIGLPLNPANLIALPLILGLGVDFGIHIIHEYREQTGPYRISGGTAVAVLVDSLTTIVGYGALMVASHQGLQSLGRVLTIGVTMCLFSSLILLPALLALITRNRVAPATNESVDHLAATEANPAGGSDAASDAEDEASTSLSVDVPTNSRKTPSRRAA
jgi:hopanoid biosynthesis associated RND transporter like protein HpnN